MQKLLLLVLHPLSMTIAENIRKVLETLPPGVKLVAVSKTKPVEDIREAYHAGQRLFGENRAQEMAAKPPLLPGDIGWHFIGHLQTNKIKTIAPFVSCIQSVDSLKLLQEIDKEARKNNRTIPCLLQFYIAKEETKFGLTEEEANHLLQHPTYRSLQNVCLSGVMGMASFSDDENLVRREFRQLKVIFDRLKADFFPADPAFCEVSMGMSDDFRIAIEEGSTMVRIGSSIFGSRSSS